MPVLCLRIILAFNVLLPPRFSPDALLNIDMKVWVKPEIKDGKVFWTADSDSQLTKVPMICALSYHIHYCQDTISSLS